MINSFGIGFDGRPLGTVFFEKDGSWRVEKHARMSTVEDRVFNVSAEVVAGIVRRQETLSDDAIANGVAERMVPKLPLARLYTFSDHALAAMFGVLPWVVAVRRVQLLYEHAGIPE